MLILMIVVAIESLICGLIAYKNLKNIEKVQNIVIELCGVVEKETGKMQYRDWETDRKSTRLNSSHSGESRMPSSA